MHKMQGRGSQCTFCIDPGNYSTYLDIWMFLPTQGRTTTLQPPTRIPSKVTPQIPFLCIQLVFRQFYEIIFFCHYCAFMPWSWVLIKISGILFFWCFQDNKCYKMTILTYFDMVRSAKGNYVCLKGWWFFWGPGRWRKKLMNSKTTAENFQQRIQKPRLENFKGFMHPSLSLTPAKQPLSSWSSLAWTPTRMGPQPRQPSVFSPGVPMKPTDQLAVTASLCAF